MAEVATYELVTLRDVFDKIPSGKIELCMAELGRGMQQAKDVWELMGSTAESMGHEGSIGVLAWPESIAWIDDGKGYVETRIACEGKELFSVASTEEPK